MCTPVLHYIYWAERERVRGLTRDVRARWMEEEEEEVMTGFAVEIGGETRSINKKRTVGWMGGETTIRRRTLRCVLIWPLVIC